MKNILFILFSIIVFWSCEARPKNFTYNYRNERTELGQRIDINGYYVSQRECDSAFYLMYMFYSDGLFTIASTTRILPELIDCFEKERVSSTCKYPLWGIYRVEGDLIKTQVIQREGNGCTVFRDFRILPDGNIVNVSDYVQPEYTNLGYMANYPSFTSNPCERIATFHPLKTKRDSMECPFIRKKWFTLPTLLELSDF